MSYKTDFYEIFGQKKTFKDVILELFHSFLTFFSLNDYQLIEKMIGRLIDDENNH